MGRAMLLTVVEVSLDIQRNTGVTFIRIPHEELNAGNGIPRHLVSKPFMCQSQVRHLFMNLSTHFQGLVTPLCVCVCVCVCVCACVCR